MPFAVAARIILRKANTWAVYSPVGGAPVGMWVDIGKGVQRFPATARAQTAGPQIEISILAEHGISPKRGDTVQHGQDTYRVEGLVDDDGYILTVNAKQIGGVL